MSSKIKFIMLVFAVVFALALVTGIALAEDSPSVVTMDTTTLHWTGQGVPVEQLCGASADFGAGGTANGASANNYLLWIFATDGGSVNGTPVLTVNGIDYAGAYNPSALDNAGAWQIVTPYIAPEDITSAFTTFEVATTGRGKWVLTISHGCAGTSIPDAEPPTATKDAAGSYDNTFTWTIDKSVDRTVVKQVGGSATFNYTVSVEYDGGSISNVRVSGDITVSNPNAADVALDSIADELSDGTDCTVSGGSMTLSSGDTAFTYECGLTGLPDGDLTNTVTIVWSEQTLGDSSHLAAGSADFTTPAILFTGNDVDECANVDDSYVGNLGTVCVGDDNPATFTYARTIQVPAFDCKSYDNTATFTTNDTGATNSAGQTVKVCGPARTGALTMGFWQNKNGQGIIKAGASTGGVCNSATWLRQFAPFQDLGATATCTQVATYVTNIIKAANASGAAMNAMLKAQMLATALDVYFSDPALGGNQINAPAPVGGVAIDLTQVCKNIGTCSIYENVSSAFGGANSLTVLQMLAYAAGQSNAGGSAWYGQVKATQELAKDAFDAINNQVAFAP